MDDHKVICQAECHDDGRSAHQGYLQEAADVNNFASALATEAQIAERVRKQRATASALPAATVADVESLQDGSTDGSEMDMGFSTLSSQAASSHELVVNAPKPAKKPRRAPSSSSEPPPAPSSPFSTTLSDTQEEDDSRPPPTAAKAKAKVKAKAAAAQRKSKDLQKAEKFMDAKAKLLSDASLWETKPKARPINTAASTMEDLASSLLGDESASQLMNQMLELSDHAPKKLEVFTRLRKEYKSMLECMRPQDMDTLATVNADVLEDIYTWVAMVLLKDLEQDRIVWG